jgi:pimeloyl-ACP methyl ester carboxylesterase
VTAQYVVHMRISVALHRLTDVDGPNLILLHGLGERSPRIVPPYAAAWPGRIFGLDFTGHGDSTLPPGGGYTSECLAGDVDAALAAFGPAALVGRGLGAYVALLIAGARPDLVRGVVLADGPGLAGGSPGPCSPLIVSHPRRVLTTPDPYALAELSREVRPPELAAVFARAAVAERDTPHDVVVTAAVLPPWLQAVVEVPGVVRLPLGQAIDRLAGAAITVPS